jgi:hypothetical protein
MASIINANTSGGLISTGDTSGQLQLQTAGTTALTVTSAQLVGIGTSSPANTVQISSPTTTDGIRLFCSDSGGEGLSVIWQSAYGSNRITGSMKSSASGAGGSLTINVADTSAVLQTRLFINNAGNVGIGIGTTSPSYKLVAIDGTNSKQQIVFSDNATYFGSISHNSGTGQNEYRTEASGAHGWFIGTSSTTANMTLDSSGNLLVGATANGQPDANYFMARNASGFQANIGHATGTASGQPYVYMVYGGAAIGSITQSGTSAVNFNGNSVPPSDQRLKTNIIDAPSAQTLINNIRVRSFDWIADNNHQTYGMIAQELMEVAPEVVPRPLDENIMMGIDYAKLVPVLIKAIQELSTQLTELKAEVATLRGA